MSNQNQSLRDKLEQVRLAGVVLEKAGITQTKKAAVMLRDKTDDLIESVIGTIEKLENKVEQLGGGDHV